MSDSDPVNLSMGAARRTANAVRAWERTATVERGKNRQWPIPEDGGGGCDTQNAIIDIIIFGSPTGGTFDMVLTVNSVAETLTFNWDDTTTDVATELATHTQLASSDFSVSGYPFPNGTMRIEFTGTVANTPIALPLTDWSLLTGGTGTGIICVLAQLGHA